MSKPNTEWMLVGSAITEFESVGAKSWELRLIALKGGRFSLRDYAKMAVKHECDASAPMLIPKEGAES